MPINLNEELSAQAVSAAACSPRFFDEALTGKGKASSVGLLSSKNDPINVPADNVMTHPGTYSLRKKDTVRNGQTTVQSIPVSPVYNEIYTEASKFTVEDFGKLKHVGKYNRLKNFDLYLTMQPAVIGIQETFQAAPGHQSNANTAVGSKSKTFTFGYNIFLYAIPATATAPIEAENISNRLQYNRALTANAMLSATNAFVNALNHTAIVAVYYSENPRVEFFQKLRENLEARGCTFNSSMDDYIAQYSLFDALSDVSDIWQNSIDSVFKAVLDDDKIDLNVIGHYAKYLMTYNIPLERYKQIYSAINGKYQTNDARTICKMNLNLLLSDTLNDLAATKPTIPALQTPNPANPLPQSVQNLSSAQTKAVMSKEPLIMVQAGAGTGKSTLILRRIDYLVSCGVKESDITVLSFTNAAADHITEKNPNVHSMTIARMIHEIYTTNFTNHELSSLDTIANSLEIYYPNANNTSVAKQFRKRVLDLISNDTHAFTEMNNFIEDHYDEVINMLNVIGQTSLELEIIICYQRINTFSEPASVQSKYLIIDEVQDNSIFEFVYMLKYITKHKESLFIVGDASQTLYEFRASNPRALNILESSGVFTTYQLKINYRSTQEILNFANIVLSNIEANKYANIQLMSNAVRTPTEQEFLDTVQFNYHRLTKMSEWKDSIMTIFLHEVKPYIDSRLAKGEQIAVLAFTRNDISMVKEALAAIYPDKTAVSLVPQRTFNSTVISNYIRKYWDQVKFMPMNHLAHQIYHDILSKLDYIVPMKNPNARAAIQAMLEKWLNTQAPTIQALVQQFVSNAITSADLMEKVRDNLLHFEIEQNSIKQALLSAQNQQNKQTNASQNAHFLLSTIHSAKGLEFDNVIVLYKNDNVMTEDKKRMYYVALTRAMKSEYILAYDTVSTPQIESDYLAVCAELHKQAPAANSPLRKAKTKIKI